MNTLRSSGEIEVVITAREARMEKVSVRRSLPTARRRMVGPFTFLDHIGPIDAEEARLTVLPHPHIGLATLTYLFEGELIHRDSLGTTQAIQPREVNWMVSGHGIAHSERAPQTVATMHAVQAWVALPSEEEEIEPSFIHIDERDIPAIDSPGVSAQLLAGSAYGLKSAVPAYSPLFYIAARLSRGASLPMPSEHSERAAYVASGVVEHGGGSYAAGQLIVFAAGGGPFLTATSDAEVLILGGEPVGRRYMWWNFVSSRKERIDQAKADWVAGRITLPPDDNHEFVPLPHESWPKPKPEPMS